MLTRRGGKVAEFRIFNDTFELEVRFGIECNGVNPCIAVFYAGEVNLSGKGLGKCTFNDILFFRLAGCGKQCA